MASVEAVARENGAVLERARRRRRRGVPGRRANSRRCGSELAGARRLHDVRAARRGAPTSYWPRPEWHGDHWQVSVQTPAGACELRLAYRRPPQRAQRAGRGGLRARRRRARSRRSRAAWRRSRRSRAARSALALSAAAARSRWSTTPTTPTPTRCAPRSTCWPRCPARAGWCWATWARSATRGRSSTPRSAPTRASAASSSLVVGRWREHVGRRSRRARHFDDIEALIAALRAGAGVQRACWSRARAS